MRLLLIEDDPKLAQYVARGMRAQGYAVDVATDGLQGEQHLLTYPYDLLILDLMLPRLSGTALLTKVRQQNAKLPVLILTARDAIDDKIRHFEIGADDYLTKPFEFAELLIRVKALLRRGPVERANVLQVADLTVDQLSQQVRRAEQRIELTAKEFALLSCMMTHPGRVYSRAMIIDNVWDQSFAGVTSIVDVYVRYLRRKIDDPYPKKLIHTVRGVGYCIRDPDAS